MWTGGSPWKTCRKHHGLSNELDSLLTIEVMKLPRKQLEAVLLYHYQGMTVRGGKSPWHHRPCPYL